LHFQGTGWWTNPPVRHIGRTADVHSEAAPSRHPANAGSILSCAGTKQMDSRFRGNDDDLRVAPPIGSTSTVKCLPSPARGGRCRKADGGKPATT